MAQQLKGTCAHRRNGFCHQNPHGGSQQSSFKISKTNQSFGLYGHTHFKRLLYMLILNESNKL